MLTAFAGFVASSARHRFAGKHVLVPVRSVENPMDIHRIECAETAVYLTRLISIQLSLSAKARLVLQVNATVNA